MITLNSRDLSLNDVHRLFGFQKHYGSFTSFLTLEPVTEYEQQELVQIKDDFERYLNAGKVSEGQVKFLALAPLMRLAGFYRYPLQITLEENIADILIEDEDTKITGRMDILAVNKSQSTIANPYFWALVLESKNSEVYPSAGLPQLLTYTYKSLEHQSSVWGLTTNGQAYQFVYIENRNSPVYYLMPLLNFMETQPAIQTLQVLKALCQLPNIVTS
jgi:hypothetical protein